jgi:hypothetical protein
VKSGRRGELRNAIARSFLIILGVTQLTSADKMDVPNSFLSLLL